MSNRLSIVFNLMQILVKPSNNERIVGKCLLSAPGSAAKTHLDNAPLPDDAHGHDHDEDYGRPANQQQSVSAVIVDDGMDDDDTTPEPEVPAPAPAPVPEPVPAAEPAKKKTVIKKTTKAT